MKSFENIKDDDDEDIKDDDGEEGKNEDDDTLPRLQVPTVAFACKPLTSIIEMILLLGGGGSETPFGSCTMLRLDIIYCMYLSFSLLHGVPLSLWQTQVSPVRRILTTIFFVKIR